MSFYFDLFSLQLGQFPLLFPFRSTMQEKEKNCIEEVDTVIFLKIEAFVIIQKL